MRVAVLGAGIQGACIAMELASRSIEVDLYDKNAQCISQASAQNEGKMHLGFFYANDPSLETARTMMRGSLSFSRLMRRWIGDAIDTVPVSAPFHYLVHDRSMVDVERLERHYAAVHAMLQDAAEEGEREYFGAEFWQKPIRDDDCDRVFDPSVVKAVFRIPEIGIAPMALARIVRERLAADTRIRLITRTTVQAVSNDGGLAVEAMGPDGVRREHYDHVVNALWDGRLAIDETMGIVPHRPWLFRYRHFLRVTTAQGHDLPSATIVLGPFGELINYGAGHLYLAWYPGGLRATSRAISPPDWSAPLSEADAGAMRQRTVRSLAELIPGLSQLPSEDVESAELGGGVIFAWGKTDIVDPESELHHRHDIGPQSFGSYHSVDTGKFVMAPAFAIEVADRIV